MELSREIGGILCAYTSGCGINLNSSFLLWCEMWVVCECVSFSHMSYFNTNMIFGETCELFGCLYGCIRFALAHRMQLHNVWLPAAVRGFGCQDEKGTLGLAPFIRKIRAFLHR